MRRTMDSRPCQNCDPAILFLKSLVHFPIWTRSRNNLPGRAAPPIWLCNAAGDQVPSRIVAHSFVISSSRFADTKVAIEFFANNKHRTMWTSTNIQLCVYRVFDGRHIFGVSGELSLASDATPAALARFLAVGTHDLLIQKACYCCYRYDHLCNPGATEQMRSRSSVLGDGRSYCATCFSREPGTRSGSRD
jgi:hypothetical protein